MREREREREKMTQDMMEVLGLKPLFQAKLQQAFKECILYCPPFPQKISECRLSCITSPYHVKVMADCHLYKCLHSYFHDIVIVFATNYLVRVAQYDEHLKALLNEFSMLQIETVWMSDTRKYEKQSVFMCPPPPSKTSSSHMNYEKVLVTFLTCLSLAQKTIAPLDSGPYPCSLSFLYNCHLRPNLDNDARILNENGCQVFVLWDDSQSTSLGAELKVLHILQYSLLKLHSDHPPPPPPPPPPTSSPPLPPPLPTSSPSPSPSTQNEQEVMVVKKETTIKRKQDNDQQQQHSNKRPMV
jgi:hypothetical protein